MKYWTAALALLAAQHAAAHSVEADPKHSIPTTLAGGDADLAANWQTSGSFKVADNDLVFAEQGKPNLHGNIWNRIPVDLEKWTVDVDFRVKGPEAPSLGGLALWYTSQQGTEGPVHGANDNWDGLAVMVDSVGEGIDSPNAHVGTIRGHLNDGTVVYNANKPEDQAFAKCQLSYRNTDYKLQLKVSYQNGFFRIMVNGQHCFQTDKIILPKGGFLGFSADSGAGDATFVSRFEVVPDIVPRVDVVIPQLQQHLEKQAEEVKLRQQQEKLLIRQQQQQQDLARGADPALQEILQKLSALEISSGGSSSGVADFEALKLGISNFEKKQSEVHAAIDRKINSLESAVKELITLYHSQSNPDSSSTEDLSKQIDKLHSRLESVNKAVKEHHSSLKDAIIPDSIAAAISKGGTSVWLPFTLLIFVQGGVFIGYLIYKKRRANYHAKII